MARVPARHQHRDHAPTAKARPAMVSRPTRGQSTRLPRGPASSARPRPSPGKPLSPSSLARKPSRGPPAPQATTSAYRANRERAESPCIPARRAAVHLVPSRLAVMAPVTTAPIARDQPQANSARIAQLASGVNTARLRAPTAIPTIILTAVKSIGPTDRTTDTRTSGPRIGQRTPSRVTARPPLATDRATSRTSALRRARHLM